MSGMSLAAMLLALAMLADPVGSRYRLPMLKSKRRALRPAALTLAAVTALLAGSILPLSAVVVGVVIAVAAVARIRKRRCGFRRLGEGRALAAALETLVGELSVGAHPMSAFAVAAAESGGPVGDALRAVASRAQFGADVARGIRDVAHTSAVPGYWNRLAVCWELAAEHGLAMSVLMRTAHRDIVDRQRFADRTHAALAGARATATILAALPFLGVLLGQLIGAHPVRYLFGGGLGGGFLIVGVCLMCAGVAWADHIIDRLTA